MNQLGIHRYSSGLGSKGPSLRVGTAKKLRFGISDRLEPMSDTPYQRLLEALLDSWERNNTILINLLRAIPEDAFGTRAMQSSPSVAELFGHIHYVRLVFVSEDAPEFAGDVPREEWSVEADSALMEKRLNESAKAIRNAVKSRVETGKAMELHYDHPILLLQHMIWHEGYHHGQIKLALKLAGRPISNAEAGPISWRIWMNKTKNK